MNNKTPSFHKLLYRSTEQSRGAFDKRREPLDKRHLLVEAAVERLAVSLCSHKRLLEPKILVDRKLLCRLNRELVQLASVPEFVAEHNVPQQV